jgi:hypothetical protein
MQTFSCAECGRKYAGREAFVKHLTERHPETWLARRAQRDELERLKRLQRGKAK